MERPKTSNKKMSWFGIVSVFMLAIALAVGVSTNTQAATGSFDRDNYLPSLSDTNDYDRIWMSVTDSAGNTTSSQDTITVTIKAGSNSTSFVLKETGGTTTIFTTTGAAEPVSYPVGTTSGYVDDFAGSHNFPALGASVVGLNLKELSANTGGSAVTSSSGELTVSSGNTLELLYGGSTLDTAVIKTNGGSVGFTPSSVSAVSTDITTPNLVIKITDQDENLNPVEKDAIGLADGFAVSRTGTGTTRVQIEAIDQTTGSRLSVGTPEIIARNIMLVETGNNTGIFTASGMIFGSSTVSAGSSAGVIGVSGASNRGNILVGSSTTSYYGGETIVLGRATNDATQVRCAFKIIEANASGRIGLYDAAGSATAIPVLGFTTGSSGFSNSLSGSTTVGIAGVTNNGSGVLSTTRIVAVGTLTSAFGSQTSNAVNQGTGPLVKLAEGSNYCLVQISAFTGTSTPAAATSGGTFEIGQGGSVTVTIDKFQLAGPRSGDSLKVSYLDELDSGGTLGTVTGTVAYGVSGETGTLSVDKTSPDINDYVTVTVVDGNLNNSTSTKESVADSSSLWGGTSTNRRGDRLTVQSYTSSSNSHRISFSHPDGFVVGTQTVRISSTDNTYVWVVPTSAFSQVSGPTSGGSSTVSLGTQSVSGVPLVRGASSGANSFLTSASTSSFVARLDGLDNTVEISPDGTRWVSVPIVETGANSSTFVGTIGFDYTAVRLTTNTATSIASLISDFTGTSTLYFQDLSSANDRPISSFVGTGSVIRITDGSTQEFAEVCSPSLTTLSVTKLSNSTGFDPDKTWVQVVGNDMMPQRVETLSSGSAVFRVGGYYGATYRLRYNDAVAASSEYKGGDTLAITTSNMGFTTYTGGLSTNVTGTSGPDTYIVVTLVDEDLNTSTGGAQSTFERNAATSNELYWNENGLGLPSGSSTGNVSRGYRNGGTAKIVYASTLSSILSSSVNLSSGGNTIDFVLTETDNNTGTFKGSFRLSSGSSTSNGSATGEPVIKASNGDSIYVFYNDSPNASQEDNSTSYIATTPITIVTQLGSLSLSKDSAYLSGDTVVATVVDVDRNSSLTSTDTLTSAIKVSGSNFSVGTDLNLALVETGVNSSTFVATFKTGTQTVTGSTPAVIKAIQGGILNVIYTDTSPSSTSATTQVSLSSCDATATFDAESYNLNSYALVTLADCERNANSTTIESLLSDVFIQTSSANSTKVKMTETGADTGTFLGSIQVVSSSDTTEFTKIKAAEGDTLKITYIDEVNTTGSSRTVTDEATVSAAVSPTPTATATATPTATATATATATPVPSPTLPPFPSPGASPTLPPFPSPGASPTLPPFPSPIVSPTPTVCEAEKVTVSKTTLRLKRKKSDDVTVTVTGADDCAVEGETVTATINAAGKKRISISPTSATTDASGAATFTITAKKKTGNARVTFKAGSVKKSITVKVKK